MEENEVAPVALTATDLTANSANSGGGALYFTGYSLSEHILGLLLANYVGRAAKDGSENIAGYGHYAASEIRSLVLSEVGETGASSSGNVSVLPFVAPGATLFCFPLGWLWANSFPLAEGKS